VEEVNWVVFSAFSLPACDSSISTSSTAEVERCLLYIGRRLLFSSMFVFQSVIDGDLCEYFNSLDSSKRRSIAEELDRTPAEVKSELCFY